MMIPPTMTNSLENTENQLNLKKEEESVHLLDVLKGKSDIFLSFNACLHRLLILVLLWKRRFIWHFIPFLLFCRLTVQSPENSSRSLSVLVLSVRNNKSIPVFPWVSSNPDVSFIHLPIHLRLSKRLLWNWGENNRNQSKKQTNAFKNCSNSFRRCFKLTSERLYNVLYLKQNFN